jgi:taurine transport system permease protein
MVGLQLGLGRALQGMVIGELLLVAAGVGGLILQYTARYQAGQLYVVIGILLVEAVLLTRSFYWVERRLVPWVGRSGGGRIRTRPALREAT